MAMRTAELALSVEPEQVTEEPAQSEIDIWGEKLEPTDLSEYVIRDSEISVSGGAFGDIYRGTYYPNLRKNSVRRLFRTLSQPQADKPFPVAIKVVRQVLTGGAQQREAKIVSLIKHRLVSQELILHSTSIKRSLSGSGSITTISCLSLEYLETSDLYLPL
jgi:hypothetical protein